jgi:hypothetical protein
MQPDVHDLPSSAIGDVEIYFDIFRDHDLDSDSEFNAHRQRRDTLNLVAARGMTMRFTVLSFFLFVTLTFAYKQLFSAASAPLPQA